MVLVSTIIMFYVIFWGRGALYAQVPDRLADIHTQLKSEARRAQWLVLWTDCDLEGENIAFEVRDVCLQGNPR